MNLVNINFFGFPLMRPAALLGILLVPLSSMAAELNMEGVNKYASSSEQVSSITQFSDVQPTDWAYQALLNLIERYGCIAGYPNGSFRAQHSLSRWEAAALLNACLDRVTEITHELRRLMIEFKKELAITKARVNSLEAKVGELEATQFSTTTKLTGVVRFVMGDVYRGNGYANFGQGVALRSAAQLYGQRAYDGSDLTVQNRFVNQIPSPQSQGEAFIFYRASATPSLSRELSFSTSWTGYIPSNLITTRSSSINAFAEPADTNLMQGVGNGQNLILNGPARNIISQANLTRISIFSETGFRQAVQLPSTNFTLEFLMPATNINQPLQADQISLQDRYGRSNGLFSTSSGTSSSDFSSAKILLDRKDMQAMLALANEARRAKSYAFLSDNGSIYYKPTGQYDPIVIASSAERNYLATNYSGETVQNFSASGAGLVVTPGGFVTNPTIYDNVINYLIAEYGSLSEQQRKFNYVQKAAARLIRNLAAYTTNKNYVADRNAFTFSHDAFLNFDTSFTGKDQLLFRLRANNTYGFAARAADPAASLAYDGATVEWPNGEKADVFIDKLYYRFQLGNSAVAALGTRVPQDAVLPSRGTFYPNSALLEFFTSSAGVFPSYTGTGAGVSLGQLGGSGFPLKGFSLGLAYLANEADAVAPDASNGITQGLMGFDTRFRIPVQLAWQSTNKKWLFSANYAYERGNNSMAQVGTQLALTPFLYASLNDSHQLGFTLAHQLSTGLSFSAAYGSAVVNARGDSSVLGVNMATAGDAAVMNSWMLALGFKDVFVKGNSAGLAVGGVPAVVRNGSNWNVDGSTPIALETWYQFQLTDSLSITPGAFFISSAVNNDGIGGGNVWGGVIKTQFNF